MTWHKILYLFSITALMVWGDAVEARMYQWINPASGRTQLSGKPPAWYRGKTEGPRVFVFENGRLIDDTAREVSETERQSLRTQAFERVGQPPILSKEELNTPQKAALPIPAPPAVQDAPEAHPPSPKEQTSTTLIERLKKIIADWDKRKEEEAKRLLETLPGPNFPSLPTK
jgi:hypothetical protein